MFSPLHLFQSHFCQPVLAALSAGALCGQVVITEFSAASSDRLLQWSATGVPKVGSGPAWWEASFDDTAWAQAPGPFGYGSVGAVGTDLQAAMQNRTPTVYLRKTFSVSATDAARTSGLQLLVDYDSGFVAWLNGREVARRNFGGTSAFVAFDQHAYNQRISGIAETIILAPPNTILQAGQNVLCIVAANNNNTPTTINLNWVTEPVNADSAFLIKADLQLTTAPAVTLVANSEPWKYFPGYVEPSGTLFDPGLISAVPVATGEDGDSGGPEAELDWVELHNPTEAAVSLAGWSLTDSAGDPRKWLFPPDAQIPAGGRLVVACDGKNLAAGASGATLHHTNFKLSGNGGFLGLAGPSGVFENGQYLEYPAQNPFHSYGRNSSGQWVYLADATPGRANSGTELSSIVEMPVPTVAGGFYAMAQSVSVSVATPGSQIRYTTDGSEPTSTTGTVYVAPINVSASACYRFRAFKSGMIPSAVATHTYLINQSAARLSLPAVCLTADPSRALYRPHGFMSIVGGSYASSVWGHGGNNLAYNACIPRGRFTEKPASMEILWPNAGQPSLQQDIGLRLSGSTFQRPRYQLTNQNSATPNSASPWTWNSNVQKPSFNLYFRSEYETDGFKTPFFPASAISEHRSFRLRAGKNDNTNPWIRDEAIRRIYQSMGHPSATGRTSTLYVNGVFKGFYNPTERLQVEFFQRSLGTTNGIDVRQMAGAGNGLPIEVDGGDTIHYDAMINFAKTANFTTLAAWNTMRDRLDMENFIDYLLVNILVAPSDWGVNNLVNYRERAAWGKQKFAMWDAESGLTPTRQKINMFTDRLLNATHYSQGSPVAILYTELKDSAEFRLLFADRIHKHFFNNGALMDARMLSIWDTLAAEFQPILREVSGTSNLTVTPMLRNWLEGEGDRTRYTDTPVLNRPTRRNTLLVGFTDDTAGAAFVPGHFRSANVWPVTSPPVFSQFGGTVAEGATLTITNPTAQGTIYFTTNGQDPRLPGGAVQGTAYGAPIALDRPMAVKARVHHPAATDGNAWSALTEAVFNPPAGQMEIAISEIHYHPAADPTTTPPQNEEDYEFIEILNRGTAVAELGGAKFTAGIEFTFPGGFNLAPGARAVVVHNQAAFLGRYAGLVPAGEFLSSNLSNDGETVALVDVAGNVLASVTYGDGGDGGEWPTQADGNGWSIVMADANGAQDDPANWRLSISQGGSPAQQEPPPLTAGAYINEVLANSGLLEEDAIELFNPTSVSLDVSHWLLSDDPHLPGKYAIPAGTVIPAGGFLVIRESQFNAVPADPRSFSLSSNGDDVWVFSAVSSGQLTGWSHGFSFGASDEAVSFGRHVTSQADERLVPQKSRTLGAANAGPRVGPVVITEIMYHPAAGGVEFVELRNISSSPVPLYDPLIPANTWELGGAAFAFPPGIILSPGQFLIVSAEAPAAFRSRYAIPNSIPVLGPVFGSLNNAGETLRLRKPGVPFTDPVSGAVVPWIDVDRLTYDDAAPWPASADGTGPSLERIGHPLFADDPANWRAGFALGNPGLPAVLTFSQWQQVQALAAGVAPADLPALGDHDGDGWANVIEYATGSDPLAISAQPLSIQQTSAGILLTCHRSQGTTGLSLGVAESPDLQSWEPLTTAPVESKPGDGTVMLSFAQPTGIKRYFRIEVRPDP